MNIINKKQKKFILILVLLMLFNFVYPKNIHAALEFEDLTAVPARLFYWAEKGILKLLNNWFCDSDHKAKDEEQIDSNGYAIDVIKVYLTPENIIKGKFIIFDANIFREITEDQNNEYYDFDIGAVKDGKIKLREIISGWYYALRNFAIIALLSVLVYVGIRMITSTIAQDKAKYKIMFKDWLVALCLVVVMHYIMIGILNVTTLITESIGTSGENADVLGNMLSLTSAITREQNDTGDDGYFGTDWHYGYEDADGTIYDIGDAYAFILVIGGIIFYTFLFAVKYLKREFTIIFLILLGPISCITYPIDKISDGKAQAYNKWFSEFLYEVIIQPFHLLLYIILVGSAAELASANVIYALVCFAVMIPAEKFVKEMFGFRDKLGSPLGAAAAGGAVGALASKAVSALTSKGKGNSGSSGDNNKNNDNQNQLPPKTVNKEELSGGNGDNDNEQRNIREQQDNQALESGETTGEEPGGGASASAAYQNSDDPVADAEKSDLEEKIADGQIDEEDLTDEQRKLLGRGGDDDEPDSPENSSNTQDNTTNNEENSLNQQTKWDKIKAIRNQRVSKKYGSTQRGQRWKRRIGKGLKFGGKTALKALKVGAIGTAGAIGIAGSLLTGNGKQALGIAAGITGYAAKEVLDGGKKAIKGATGYVKGVAKDYYGGVFRKDEDKENKALKDFKADPTQIDKAIMSYKENHDGIEPGYQELDQEMNDRFALSRYGLEDNQIDRAVGSYQKLKAGGVPEQAALNQTAFAAKLASDYSKKDFRSEKTMKEAVSSLSQKFQGYGASKALADANARKYLEQAASIKGAEIALPTTNETIDVPINRGPMNVSKSLGVQNSNLTNAQLERINRVTVRLQDAGFSDNEIDKIASNSAGGTTTEVLDRYEATVRYLGNESAIEEARKQIETRNNGQNATDAQVKSEMKERLILKSTFDVKKESDISALRNLETGTLKGKTQVEAAREFAIKNKGKLNDIPHMTKAKEDLVEKLKNGGSSRDKARKDAQNIINLASQYNN